MTPPIPGGFLFNTKFDMESSIAKMEWKVHYLVFRVQAVPRKIFGNRRMSVLALVRQKMPFQSLLVSFIILNCSTMLILLITN